MNKLGGHSLILPSKVDEVTEAVDQTKTRTRGEDANLADVINAMSKVKRCSLLSRPRPRICEVDLRPRCDSHLDEDVTREPRMQTAPHLHLHFKGTLRFPRR